MKQTNPYWYNLILTAQTRGDIVTGLTIPYLLGATEKDNQEYIAKEEDVIQLLTDMAYSDTELKPVLKECGLIHQYVIALQDADFCKSNFKNQISFKNENGENSLYIIHEAKSLGNNIEQISQNLYEEYAEQSFNKSRYSWDYNKQEWLNFSSREKETITLALINDQREL